MPEDKSLHLLKGFNALTSTPYFIYTLLSVIVLEPSTNKKSVFIPLSIKETKTFRINYFRGTTLIRLNKRTLVQTHLTLLREFPFATTVNSRQPLCDEFGKILLTPCTKRHLSKSKKFHLLFRFIAFIFKYINTILTVCQIKKVKIFIFFIKNNSVSTLCWYARIIICL